MEFMDGDERNIIFNIIRARVSSKLRKSRGNAPGNTRVIHLKKTFYSLEIINF